MYLKFAEKINNSRNIGVNTDVNINISFKPSEF